MRLHRKQRDLQPWLDYFGMLQSHEQDGFLEMHPEKHEAYVTLPALLVIAGVTLPTDGSAVTPGMLKQVAATVRRLRAYAGWRSCHGGSYLTYPFALHVVGDEEPHDLVSTFLLARCRRWWRLWMPHDSLELITY